MRPKKHRHVQIIPKIRLFRPQGLSAKNISAVNLLDEELEALRLKNIEQLDQAASAEKMGVSPSTFQRILSAAHKKVTVALIEGRAISISRLDDKKIECWECAAENGEAIMSDASEMVCRPCQKHRLKNR